MRLVLLHPEVAFRDCSHCLQFLYDEKTGKPEMRGEPSLPVARPKQSKPPCQILKPNGETRCAKGTPNAGRELTEHNWAAWVHYQECRAVGRFPDDPIVRRNAAILARVEREFEAKREAEVWEMMALAAARR